MVILTSFPPPTEGVRLTQPNTVVHVQTRDMGKGTLYIAESRLSWVGEEGRGFSLEYPAISLHAVSRDPSAYAHECLYLMIDAILHEENEVQAEESDEDEDKVDVTEIRFIPEDKESLDAMFRALTDCQLLHPDPDDSISESDEEANFEDAEDTEHFPDGDTTTTQMLSEVESALDGVQLNQNGEPNDTMDVGQFEDAEAEF